MALHALFEIYRSFASVAGSSGSIEEIRTTVEYGTSVIWCKN
jgi:hypothetical protein